jgi:MFS family permease
MMAVILVQATATTMMAVLPVLARKRFDAGDWQTLFITAAPTVFFTFSIFWNDLFSHTRFSRYMWVYWAVACLPLALVGAATNYWMVLIPHLICSLGGAGYHPATGEVLKRLYPAASRGRIYSIVWGSNLVAGAFMGYGAGKWLAHDENAFRIFLPLVTALQLVGVLLFMFLAHRTRADEGRVKVSEDRAFYDRVVEPMTHMKEVLKSDPVFARYEAAYMTYGIGWMICYALLPIFVTDHLKLNYDQIAQSTQVTYLIGMVLMIGPAGYLMDRLGAVRSTGLSFAMLVLYPLGLIGSGD